ncbi:MAG: Bax inhibitor-1/YccA family protein [SAR324 cluster bacterium]|nr:Bax inhibitor-1/YccA family protein [SAR324 cluster bacterium]
MFGQQETAPYRTIQVAASVSVGERLAFLKKVYGLLAASMLSATVGAVMGMGPLLPVVGSLGFLSILFFFGSFMFLMFVQRKPGLNMVALFSFTTIAGLMIGPMLNMYVAAGSGFIVLEALGLTTVTFVGLTAYVIFSKKDFSFMSGFLMTGLIILIVGGLINLFLQSSMMHFVFSGAGVLLFSGFILYDTSNILRNYSTDDYVSATVALFLDVFNLFLHLLSFLGLARD